MRSLIPSSVNSNPSLIRKFKILENRIRTSVLRKAWKSTNSLLIFQGNSSKLRIRFLRLSRISLIERSWTNPLFLWSRFKESLNSSPEVLRPSRGNSTRIAWGHFLNRKEAQNKPTKLETIIISMIIDSELKKSQAQTIRNCYMSRGRWNWALSLKSIMR